MIVLDDDLTDALDKWEELIPIYSKAKSVRVQLESFKKSKHSALTLEAEGSSNAEKEHRGYAHKEYVELLKAVATAGGEEGGALWGLKLAEAKVGVWRTLQSNKRTEAKIL